MTEFTEDFPSVAITGNPDSTITVEQSFSGNVERVALHRMHVRFMAEKLGLLPVSLADGPAASHRTEKLPMLLADLARMERALLRIRMMSSELAQSLGIVAEHCQEDLSHEVGMAGELSDFVAFICEDFERAPHAPASPSASTSTTPPREGAAA